MSEPDRSTAVGAAVLRFFGAALMAIGGLIAILSGLCTAWGGLQFLTGDMAGGNFGQTLGLVAVFGGIPIAVGVGLYFLGRWIGRKAERP